MEQKHITKLRNNIYELLELSQLNEAFTAVESFIEQSGLISLKDEMNQLKMSYQFMLQYLSQGILDPQRDDVLNRIIRSLYVITDKCVIAANENFSYEVFYTRRREFESTSLNSLIDNWLHNIHKRELLASVPEHQRDYNAINKLYHDTERDETSIFNKLWCSFPTSIDDASTIRNIIDDNKIPSHAKCLFLSAWFLGLMKFYDETKLISLIEIYTLTHDTEVQMRAMIYAILSLYIYNKRIQDSSAIKMRIKAMTEVSTFASDFATLQFLLARTRNTDNISKRVREDLMPGFMDMKPDLINKFKDKNRTLDISDIEANPDWQDFLDSSGINKKIEEFNEMQLNGHDVFISTFSHLKSFPFFQTMSNWFLPYHTNHSVIINTFGNNENTLKDIISNAPFLCNSDKYSFCLSMASVPQSQREIMMHQIREQNAELKDFKKAQLPNDEKSRESITNKHLQDLYRFFKLFSRRREFVSVFDMDMDLMSMPFLEDYTCDNNTVTIIAEFYFKNKFYDDAIKYYNHILKSSDTVNPIIFQKIGFAHQNQGNYRSALNFYNKYLLAHENDIWTLKHMASCYKQLKRYDRAMECYENIEQLQPNSVANTLNTGNCLFESGNYADALQYYLKVDFMDGAKHKAWRPIAWCSFLTQNDQRALNYYDKIITEDKASIQDYINRGHVLLCNNRIQEALENYRQAISLDNDISYFTNTVKADAPQLKLRGISMRDLSLIIDALKLK